jgi:hypothetical protein
METWMVIAIGAAIVAAIVVVLALVMRSKQRKRARQTSELREGFGPEYTTAVAEQGRAGGEADLLQRQERADQLHVRPLSAAEVTSYTERWAAAQAAFIDDPGAALTAADRLLIEIVGARGYPGAEFEEGASALSVDHPRAVQDYRSAHEVVLRNRHNAVPTEELRAAMLQYHSVFSELVGGGAGGP